MAKIANRHARQYVSACKPFTGSNLYAETRPLPGRPEGSTCELYAVFSYGEHFPMFIYAAGRWFENKDRYSPTTSKQQGQARPSAVDRTVRLSTAQMQAFLRKGFEALLTGEGA